MPRLAGSRRGDVARGGPGGTPAWRHGTVRLMTGTPGGPRHPIEELAAGPSVAHHDRPHFTSTMPRAMNGPAPRPMPPRVRAGSPRNATSNARQVVWRFPAAGVGDVTQARPPCTSARTSTPPSAGVCLIALSPDCAARGPSRPIDVHRHAAHHGAGEPHSLGPGPGSALATTSATRSSSPVVRLASRRSPWMRDSSNRSSIITVSHPPRGGSASGTGIPRAGRSPPRLPAPPPWPAGRPAGCAGRG